MLGDLQGADEHLARAVTIRNLGPGSKAAVVGERAELHLARGNMAAAADRWRSLATSLLPLWSGIGHLRLAEEVAGEAGRVSAAAERFHRVQSHWGIVRAEAVRSHRDRDWVADRARALGPPGVFMARGPWLM